MLYLGIDCGTAGGFALVDGSSTIVAAEVLPVFDTPNGRVELDVAQLDVDVGYELRNAAVGRGDGLVVTVEALHAFPGDGVVGLASMMRMYGELIGWLKTKRYRYSEVNAATWQKATIGAVKTPKLGKDATKSEKAAARRQRRKAIKAAVQAFCRKTWPGVDLRASDACKVPHDGIADALAIAEYGRRVFLGSVEGESRSS